MSNKEQNTVTTATTAEERAKQILELRGGRRPADGLVSRFPKIGEREGFKTHWFNDHKGKIEQKLQDGWEFATRKDYVQNVLKRNNKDVIGTRVGVREDGSDMHAYALEIPLEIYNLDKKERESRNEKRMDYIMNEQPKESGAKVTENTTKSNFR